MSEPGSFDAVVGQIVGGTAPRQVRAAAARGALPLPRAVLVRLYVALLTDEDAEISSDAERSIEGLDAEAMRDVLGDTACAPEVLEHFAPAAARDEALAERITFNPSAPDAALSALAGQGNGKVIDLVLTNEERLLRTSGLLDTLISNPALRADQRGRILELLDRVMRRAEATRAAAASGDENETPVEEAGESIRLLDLDVGELLAQSEISGGEEFEEAEDPVLRSAYQRVVSLSTAHKAILAMRGGREERQILIRDTNKIVSLGVLRNPRLGEEEVERIAMSRNVSGDVLREIGQNREWAKTYAIVLALVKNPKSPQGVTTNFVSRLHTQDLKRLATSHDAPELIRRMVKRQLQLRTPRSGRR